MNAACIAVVDDEAPVRTALRRLLRLADYEVATYESVSGAVLVRTPSAQNET